MASGGFISRKTATPKIWTCRPGQIWSNFGQILTKNDQKCSGPAMFVVISAKAKMGRPNGPRPNGPGPNGPAKRARAKRAGQMGRPNGPGPNGPAKWARAKGAGQMGKGQMGRPNRPGPTLNFHAKLFPTTVPLQLHVPVRLSWRVSRMRQK